MTSYTGGGARILVIEDDPGVRQVVTRNLAAHGFRVEAASAGREGLDREPSFHADLVLLDLGLPDMSGLDVITELRERTSTPIIVLSIRGAEKDKVRALDLGADDYLTKPFAIQELEARLRALIRRERRQVGSEVLKVADLVLDPASLRATRGGVELQLSPIGLKLLTILMRESPRVVSRQEIEREIWGNSLPDSDTLRSHLYNLRKTIDKPYDKPLLHTVQSAGYRIADIEQPPA